MTVSFQRMFGILERLNNNQVTPSLSKRHELSYRSNIYIEPVTENLIEMAGFERRNTGVEVRHADHEPTKNNWE